MASAGLPGAGLAPTAPDMRILFVVFAVLLLVPGWTGTERLPLLQRGDPRITVTPVPLVASDPTVRRNGSLTYLGGVRLDSPDPAFGGFSSMTIAGDRFTLLSDGGGIVRFRMGADWRPRDAMTMELPGGPGTGWHKQDRDSESMAILRDGSIVVGFERANGLWRYSGDFARVLGSHRPAEMRKWSENSGPEAIALLPDGSFVVLSESSGSRKTKGYAALRFRGDPINPATRRERFRYLAPAGFGVTDAVAVPGGRLLVLVRRFGWPQGFTARLQVVPIAAIRPGAVVVGKTIATFEGDVIHDNFEALAVTREGERDILWIASDDNQNFWQRSLLLKFRLDLPRP